MNLVSEINSTGLYATVGKNYIYEDASGNDAVEPISALRAKQDALTFNYNNYIITGINNSSIGGPGALSGIAYSASPNAYFIPIDENLIYKSVEVDGVVYTAGLGINTNGTTTNNTGYTGQYSFVIGRNTCAEYGGFAGGIGCSADGEGSFAIGNTSYASNGGHAIGNNVSANDQNILVIGKYNYQQSDAYLVIGNGTNNTEGKSDILVVDDDGLTVNSDIKYRYDNNTSSLTSLTQTVNGLNSTVQGYSTIIGTVENNYQNWNEAYTDVNTSSNAWNSIATNGLTGVSVDSNQLTVTNNTVNIVLTGKVDKENGKGLSTNDYVNSAKTVVDNAALVIPSDAAADNQLVTTGTVAAALANVGHFEIASLNNNDEPDVSSPSTKIFYLTKPSSADQTDPYTEWIYTESDDPTPVTAWNVIGSTQIDLNGYAKVPTAYTANHILTYDSTTQTLLDAGVTTAQIGGSISGITLNGGNELTIDDKVIDIPLATNTNNVGTDGIMAGADKVKLDNMITAYASDDYLSLNSANQTVTYGLNVTTGTYSNTDIITQIGGSGLSAFIADSANSAANANKLNGQNAGYYATDNNAKAYANFAGGNGITIGGELLQTKTIASNLTEYQLQEGVGIEYEIDDVNQEITFNAKPEVFLYFTTTPQMTYASIAFDSTNSAGYNSKNGDIGISNTQITGLDSNKLYHCNVKLLVENDTASPATVSVAATNWNNDSSVTYEYVNSNNIGSMELDWYVKGQTSIGLTGSGTNANLQIGVKEIMVQEVCNA